MARIIINDIPGNQEISREELKRIRGGSIAVYNPEIGQDDQLSVMFNPEKVTIKKNIGWENQKEDYEGK